MTTNEIDSIKELLDDAIRAMKNGETIDDILTSTLNQMKLEDCSLSKEDVMELAEHIVFGLYDGKFPEETGFYSGQTMVLFTQRMQIEELYLNWCKENGVAEKPNSLVAFMQINDWLNEEQIMADLKLMDVFKKKVDKLKVTKPFEKGKEMSEDEAHQRWG